MVSTTLYFGPQTINVGAGATPDGLTAGDYGVCQSYSVGANGALLPTGCTIGTTPLTLAAGQEDFDSIGLSLVDILTTTTNTDLLTQDYNLVGVPLAAPVPEPPTWFVYAMLVAGTGYVIRQRIKDRAARPSA